MDADLVNKFIGSAHNVLSTEVGEPITVGKVSVQTEPYTSQEVTTLVGMTGTIQGVMMFGLSKETAMNLVSRMMGQEIEQLDELAQSGIAELGNVIAGSAATNLASKGHSCNIAPPTVILGAGATISTVSIPRLVIPLLTACGLVEMQLAMKLSGVQK